MAIGTGNIWRFPRIVAANGGGTFLVPWLIFLVSWSIPLLIVESGMGKAARRGTVGAFKKIVGPSSTWRGAFVGFCAMAIGFYYSVVTGWCLKYFLMSISGGLLERKPSDAQRAAGGWSKEVWNELAANPVQQVLFHFVALGLSVLIIVRGVSSGIERLNRVLIPALFVILVIAAVRAVTLPGAMEGMSFLFTFRLSGLGNHEIWLAALSQSAWSTGAGAGLILTYSAYARRDQNVVFSSVTAGLGNNAASLLAAIAESVRSSIDDNLRISVVAAIGVVVTGKLLLS